MIFIESSRLIGVSGSWQTTCELIRSTIDPPFTRVSSTANWPIHAVTKNSDAWLSSLCAFVLTAGG